MLNANIISPMSQQNFVTDEGMSNYINCEENVDITPNRIESAQQINLNTKSSHILPGQRAQTNYMSKRKIKRTHL